MHVLCAVYLKVDTICNEWQTMRLAGSKTAHFIRWYIRQLKCACHYSWSAVSICRPIDRPSVGGVAARHSSVWREWTRDHLCLVDCCFCYHLLSPRSQPKYTRIERQTRRSVRPWIMQLSGFVVRMLLRTHSHKSGYKQTQSHISPPMVGSVVKSRGNTVPPCVWFRDGKWTDYIRTF